MLDSLFSKCTSLAHFQSVVGLIDQVGNVFKTAFGGPIEQETLDIITALIQAAAKTPGVPAAPVKTQSTESIEGVK